MILIFTGNEELNKELSKTINDSRIVYYPDYVLEEKQAKILITTVQDNMFNFKDFLLKVRNKNIRVILILEDEKQKELNIALKLGIYDLVFDPFEIKDITQKIEKATQFSEISKYIYPILEEN